MANFGIIALVIYLAQFNTLYSSSSFIRSFVAAICNQSRKDLLQERSSKLQNLLNEHENLYCAIRNLERKPTKLRYHNEFEERIHLHLQDYVANKFNGTELLRRMGATKLHYANYLGDIYLLRDAAENLSVDMIKLDRRLRKYWVPAYGAGKQIVDYQNEIRLIDYNQRQIPDLFDL